MTANVGLANIAPSDTVHGEAHAHSSIEVKDSCNCFKFCFPCFGRKIKKEDPRKLRNSRTLDIMKSAIAADPMPSARASPAILVPHPEYNRTTIVNLTDRSSDRPVRSPGMEDLHRAANPETIYGTVEQDLTLHVTISSMDLNQAKVISSGNNEVI